MVGTATSLLLLFLTPNSSILEQATQKETRPIRIAFSPWVGDAALVLARDEFKKNNVPVELVVTENVSKAEELYLNGLVDGLSSTYTNTIFRNSRA